jgi:hypothetical protein
MHGCRAGPPAASSQTRCCCCCCCAAPASMQHARLLLLLLPLLVWRRRKASEAQCAASSQQRLEAERSWSASAAGQDCTSVFVCLLLLHCDRRNHIKWCHPFIQGLGFLGAVGRFEGEVFKFVRWSLCAVQWPLYCEYPLKHQPQCPLTATHGPSGRMHAPPKQHARPPCLLQRG